MRMRALTVRQPWAWLIAAGHKPVENRCWRCDYRGPLLIHAASTMTQQEYFDALNFVSQVADVGGKIQVPAIGDLVMAAVLAVCSMDGSVTEHESKFFTGTYGFMLRDVEKVEPIPAKGIFTRGLTRTTSGTWSSADGFANHSPETRDEDKKMEDRTLEANRRLTIDWQLDEATSVYIAHNRSPKNRTHGVLKAVTQVFAGGSQSEMSSRLCYTGTAAKRTHTDDRGSAPPLRAIRQVAELVTWLARSIEQRPPMDSSEHRRIKATRLDMSA